MKQQLKQTPKKKTNQLQEALIQFIQAIAQALQAQPEEVMLVAQANPQALEQAIQAFQSTLDINQAAQTFAQASQLAAQKAAHGAKLNYVRKITNRCADDEETYFYKVGGKIGCGCKKKEQGGKVVDDGKSVIARFKEKCGGKMKKHQLGGSLNGVPFMLGGNKVPSIGTTYYGYVLDKNRSLFGSGFRWYPTNAPIGRRAVGLDKSITINGITLNPDGTWSKKESPISTYIPVRTTTSTDSLAFPSDTLVQDSIVAPIDTARIDTSKIPRSLIAAGDSLKTARDSITLRPDSIAPTDSISAKKDSLSTDSLTNSPNIEPISLKNDEDYLTLKSKAKKAYDDAMALKWVPSKSSSKNRETGSKTTTSRNNKTIQNNSSNKTSQVSRNNSTSNSKNSQYWKKTYNDWNNKLSYKEMKALDNLGIDFSNGTKKLQLELNRVFSLKYGNNPAFGAPLVEDGKLGPKTLAKIKNAIYLGMSSSTNEFKKGGLLRYFK